MEYKQATELMSKALRCLMHANGIIDEKPEIIEATLPELLEADSVVKLQNQAERAKGAGKTVQQMTIADRGLAALYTAISFEGGTPEEPNVVAYGNGNYVLVIAAKHLDFEKVDAQPESKEGER